jgi:hypothetical protein
LGDRAFRVIGLHVITLAQILAQKQLQAGINAENS